MKRPMLTTSPPKRTSGTAIAHASEMPCSRSYCTFSRKCVFSPKRKALALCEMVELPLAAWRQSCGSAQSSSIGSRWLYIATSAWWRACGNARSSRAAPRFETRYACVPERRDGERRESLSFHPRERERAAETSEGRTTGGARNNVPAGRAGTWSRGLTRRRFRPPSSARYSRLLRPIGFSGGRLQPTRRAGTRPSRRRRRRAPSAARARRRGAQLAAEALGELDVVLEDRGRGRPGGRAAPELVVREEAADHAGRAEQRAERR